MTVTYSKQVTTVKFWTFIRVLLRWRGSIYKLVLPDLSVFVILYAVFSLIYRFALPSPHKENFEQFCVYCSRFENLIPVAFVLGFFVQMVATRWWSQVWTLPYPDNLAIMLNAYIEVDDDGSQKSKCHIDGVQDDPTTSRNPEGDTETENRLTPSEKAKLIRRTIMRYVNLSFAVGFRRVAYRVKKKIPSEETLIKENLITEDEMKIWNAVPVENKYFLPLIWCNELVQEAVKDGLIKDHLYAEQLLEEINAIRGKLGMIFSYDYINIPLAYTQAATVSVYTYFLACLFGRQYLDPTKNLDNQNIDLYVPVFTMFQFIFYVGWLKVAEVLINPYGADDDDFDVMQLLKRNIQMSSILTSPKITEVPTLQDTDWDEPDSEMIIVKNVKKDNMLTGSAMRIGENEGGIIQKIRRQVSGQDRNKDLHELEELANVVSGDGDPDIPVTTFHPKKEGDDLGMDEVDNVHVNIAEA